MDLSESLVSDIEWMTDWTEVERVTWSVRCLGLLDEILDVAGRTIPVDLEMHKTRLASDVHRTIALRQKIVEVLTEATPSPVPYSRLETA